MVWIKCYLYLSLGLTLTLNNFAVIIVLLVQVHHINFSPDLLIQIIYSDSLYKQSRTSEYIFSDVVQSGRSESIKLHGRVNANGHQSGCPKDGIRWSKMKVSRFDRSLSAMTGHFRFDVLVLNYSGWPNRDLVDSMKGIKTIILNKIHRLLYDRQYGAFLIN